MRNAAARVGPGGANQNALRVAGAAQHLLVEHEVIAAQLQWPVIPIIEQPGIAVQNADDFNLVA